MKNNVELPVSEFVGTILVAIVIASAIVYAAVTLSGIA